MMSENDNSIVNEKERMTLSENNQEKIRKQEKMKNKKTKNKGKRIIEYQ